MVKKNVMVDAIAGAATNTARKADDVDKLEVVLHETSVRDLKLQRSIAILTGWVNSVIEPSKMVVQDFFDDLYDAKILIKLMEIKTGVILPASLSAVSYKAILENVKTLIKYLVDDLGIDPKGNWTAGEVAQKQVASILFMVKDIAHHFGMIDRLPPNVTIVCVHMQKKVDGHIERKVKRQEFTDGADETVVKPMRGGSDDEAEISGDVFDKLLVASSDKVDQVRKLLLSYVNGNMAKLTGVPMTIRDFGQELCDGVVLIKLLGIIGNCFIARNEYHEAAPDDLTKSHNMKVVLSLMSQFGVECGGLKKKEMIEGNVGMQMRAVYRLYQKFKPNAA